MAKKKKLQSTAPVPMTRGQLSRAQQEQKRVRNLYTAAIGVGSLVLLILGLAIVTTFIIRPNQQVARVNLTEDKVITRATYNKMRRYNIYQTIQSNAFQQQMAQQTGSTTGIKSSDELIKQLRNVDNESPLDDSTIYQLEDAELLRQASQKDFGINPTQDELKATAIKDFVPQPTTPIDTTPVSVSPTMTGTATISATPTSTATPTHGSPTKTPTQTATLPPVVGAQKTAEAGYNSFLTVLKRNASTSQGTNVGPDLSESEFLTLVMEPRVRKDKVTEKLVATGVMTEVEQIHAQHILTDTEEGAKKIKDMLDKGADFTEVANTQSKEQLDNQSKGQAPNGGDLGWFPREGSNLVKEFVEGAWPVQAGKYSNPVKTSFGWHIIKVLERDPKRPLDQSAIDQKKTTLYDDWFKKAKDAAQISPRPVDTPVPPTPAIVNPTAPPVRPSAAPAGSPTAATTSTGSTPSSPTTPTLAGSTPLIAPTVQPGSSGTTGAATTTVILTPAGNTPSGTPSP